MWVWLFNLVSLTQCHITLVLCKADPDLLFLDQTEDQRAEKNFFENSPPPISGPGWPPPPQQWSLSTTSGQLDSAQNVANGLLISLWCTTCLAEEASTCKFQRGCCLHNYHPKIKRQLQIKGSQSKVQDPQGQGLSSCWPLTGEHSSFSYQKYLEWTVYNFVVKCYRCFILLFFGFGVSITFSISNCQWWNQHVAINRKPGCKNPFP